MTSSPTRSSAQSPLMPWAMLALLSAGFISLTLNWFDVAAAFGLIAQEFHVGFGSLSFLISVFIVSYGLAHIPGGMLATAIGMKKTLVIGLLIQGVAGIMSGLSYNYTELVWFRVLSGIGGSIFIAVGFGAVIVWFHDREVTLALGLSGGAAFSAGAAFALYVWIYLQRATSWHTSLVLAGVIELITCVATIIWFRVPEGAPALHGATFDRQAVTESVVNRDLWVYGISFLGAYGAYFATSQLFATYAVAERGLDSDLSGLMAALIALAGIPGSVLGGWWGDRTHNLRIVIVLPLVLSAGLLALIPVVSTGALWAVGIGIGFLVILSFSAWAAVPARVSGIKHEHIGTATGLMLTLAAVGGFFIPIIFGHIVPDHSFNAGWEFLAIVSVAFALLGLLGRNPSRATVRKVPAAGSVPVVPSAATGV